MDKLGGADFSYSKLSVLNQFHSQISCVDIPISSSRFTWKKKKARNNNIFERLERVVASIAWLSEFPQAKITHHPFTSSDHCIISLDFLSLKNNKAPPFRFEKMWCARKDYDTLVKKICCTLLNGSFMYCLTKKCKLLKEKSKVWNKTQFGNIFRQLRIIDKKLAII